MQRHSRVALAIAVLAVLVSARAAAIAAPSDYWITTKTKIALLTAKDVPGTSINVDTVDGRVALYGKVGSDNAKAKAESIARGIDGVKEVRNLLQVQPEEPRSVQKMRKQERELIADVDKALKDDPSVRGTDVRVKSAAGGVVLLTGNVPNETVELHAIQVAHKVDGVDGVMSEIRSASPAGPALPPRDAKVVPPAETRPAAPAREAGKATDTSGEGRGASGALADAWITSDVKVRLLADSRTPGTDINVDTMNGRVTLFGSVPDTQAKTAAEEIARKVDGVTGVDNALQIVPKSQEKAVEARDDQIEKAVKDAIDKRADLKDASITTEVKNGVVKLSGKVPDPSVHVIAVRVVRSTPGVKGIQDNLVLK